jgi:vancomycin permeability regulator SanA
MQSSLSSSPSVGHSMTPPRRRIWRRVVRWSLLSTCALLVLGASAIAWVQSSIAPHLYTEGTTVPARRVAIVFGAGVRPDGRLSRILAQRVDAAIALYQAGTVAKLLMTGDNAQPEYNEVAAMRRYAVDRGVPPDDITLDYAGFRTYDSCVRAVKIFGVEAAVLVTQRYHQPRALYTCRAVGIDAVGLGVPDWEIYPTGMMRFYTLREYAAILVSLVEVHITHPAPRFLGPFEGIS